MVYDVGPERKISIKERYAFRATLHSNLQTC